MRGFSERPKSMGPVPKQSLTSDDVPSKPPASAAMATTSMRRANTNESLVGLEIEALSSTPPDPSDWAHKQLMGMVNRSADGQRVMGDEELLDSFHSRASAFTQAGRTGSSPVLTPEYLSTSPLGHSQPVGSPNRPRSLISSSSASALLGTSNMRRGTGSSSVLEARMKLKREKDLQMARHIMEEEGKKARDREKLREAEERLRAKAIREKQEQQELKEREQLKAFYDHEKQHSQSNHSPSDLTYFRSMKKKIKDINVKPTLPNLPNLPNLPSIGLDEKLKKFNTRVKGFLSTTNPTGFSLPIKKNKANKPGGIKMNIVDDFMKDLELQRMADESSIDSRDGLSPIIEMHSNASSSPTDVRKRARARKRMSEIRLANKNTSELQLLIRSLNQDLQSNNDSIAAAQQTCAKIRAEMESTKTMLTRDVEATGSKVSRANTLGTQFATTVKEIRTQLDTTRNATVACSDQIKQLEVHVQKVQRAKKPTDRVMRYIILALVGMGILYLVANYRSCQVLAVITGILMIVRIVKEQHSGVNGTKTPWFTIVQDSPLPGPKYLSPKMTQPLDNGLTTADTTLSSSSPESEYLSSSPSPAKKDEPVAALGGMRRNHSDLVLQSLLSEEEFSELFNTSPKLGSLKEEDETMGISPGRSRRAAINSNTLITTTNNTIPNNNTDSLNPQGKNSIRLPIRNNIVPTETKLRPSGPLRTSNSRDKESVAMNLAIHNLNQMSLKIQQMQQGK